VLLECKIHFSSQLLGLSWGTWCIKCPKNDRLLWWLTVLEKQIINLSFLWHQKCRSERFWPLILQFIFFYLRNSGLFT
jgi:hypothetical protein